MIVVVTYSIKKNNMIINTIMLYSLTELTVERIDIYHLISLAAHYMLCNY